MTRSKSKSNKEANDTRSEFKSLCAAMKSNDPKLVKEIVSTINMTKSKSKSKSAKDANDTEAIRSQVKSLSAAIKSNDQPLTKEIASKSINEANDTEAIRSEVKSLCAAIKSNDQALVKEIASTMLNEDRNVWTGAKYTDSSPIHAAAEFGKTECLAILLDLGFNINAVFNGGKAGITQNITALHIAIIKRNIDTVNFLVKNNAKMDIYGEIGNSYKGTALKSASKCKSPIREIIFSKFSDYVAQCNELLNAFSEAPLKQDKSMTEFTMNGNTSEMDKQSTQIKERELDQNENETKINRSSSSSNLFFDATTSASADEFLEKVKEKFEKALETIKKNLSNGQDISEEIKIKEEEIRKLEDDIQRLKSSSDFKTEEEMENLEEAAVNMQNKLGKLQLLLKGRNDKELQESLICVICLEVPNITEEDPSMIVLSCGNCDSLMCSLCKPLVEECVSCKVNFEEKEPKRNKWAERFIKLKP